jgi:2-C-methyl-D-erythritol 4-phosphate cytidylyltransferase
VSSYGVSPDRGTAVKELDGSATADRSWSIVLAAGQGARVGQAKQFMSIAGHRMVDLAVQAASEACEHVVLVVPRGHVWQGPPVDTVVEGGRDRRSSVRRGLAAIPALSGTVVVHQAANPLASPDLIRSLLATIEAGNPAAAPGLRPADLVRRVSRGVMGEVVGRDELVLVQTPAAFRLDVLRYAHEMSDVPALEDTALVTAAGFDVVVVAGDPRNIHVATQADLEVVAAVLATRR